MDSSRFESLTWNVALDFAEYTDPPPEPLPVAIRWLADAVSSGAREPKSLTLGTADRTGRSSLRTVTCLRLDACGLLFTTHSSSRKGRELAETGWASALFYWRELGRQLSLTGPVEQVDDAEADLLWACRVPALHPMSVASRQSDALSDPEPLRAEAAQLEATRTALPRPDRFTGYRIVPAQAEFWAAATDRLHLRLRYERSPQGWTFSRLQP
ncbi:pyridoxal 5'-phosphate synthase [Pseudonocardiaceae bacterium YIM PH 21723]|nr:pyridoxal 5'-phosphate synthase [Pseudonocardiaceae bacterium YIM PH 21723]